MNEHARDNFMSNYVWDHRDFVRLFDIIECDVDLNLMRAI